MPQAIGQSSVATSAKFVILRETNSSFEVVRELYRVNCFKSRIFSDRQDEELLIRGEATNAKGVNLLCLHHHYIIGLVARAQGVSK